MEFENAADATHALAAMHGFQLDSKHQFAINRFTDIEAFAYLDETFQEPEIETYNPKVS